MKRLYGGTWHGQGVGLSTKPRAARCERGFTCDAAPNRRCSGIGESITPMLVLYARRMGWLNRWLPHRARGGFSGRIARGVVSPLRESAETTAKPAERVRGRVDSDTPETPEGVGP